MTNEQCNAIIRVIAAGFDAVGTAVVQSANSRPDATFMADNVFVDADLYFLPIEPPATDDDLTRYSFPMSTEPVGTVPQEAIDVMFAAKTIPFQREFENNEEAS